MTGAPVNGKNLRVLTWHVHGSYLYYLTQSPCTFYLPVLEGRPHGYGGRAGAFPWGANVHEVDAAEVRNLDFDCILFQAKRNYLHDQYDLLTPRQRALPRIYLEHDPPRETPTDTRHVVDDPDTLLVHVTHFNDLMWDGNRTPTRVIEHGVLTPGDARYTGRLDKGIVAINGLEKRGRRLGLDVFKKVRKEVPLDLVGMESENAGGLGEVPPPELARFMAQYRFFFNPIRYTSLGLSVCEAMTVGLPVVGLATTEMAVTVENDVSGYVHTDIGYLIGKMQMLLADADAARRLSAGAAATARRKFNIDRFCRQWLAAFEDVVGRRRLESAEAGGLA